MAKALVITGTPGTGKTTLAKALQKQFSLELLDAKQFAQEHGCVLGHDAEAEALIIDEDCFAKTLENYLKSLPGDQLILVDGHISHFLSPKYTALCIVTNCPLAVLKERLTKRGYSAQKVSDNLEAEAFQECLLEAQEQGHRDILTLNPSNEQEKAELFKKIADLVK